jgi:hypothetical protein
MPQEAADSAESLKSLKHRMLERIAALQHTPLH